MATLVTALYDIGRENLKKEANNWRLFSQYLEWLEILLEVNAFIIIFIPPELEKYVKKYKNVKAIIMPFSSLPLYQRKEEIEEVMKKMNSPFPNLELHVPEYIIVIYSKFFFLQEAIKRYGSGCYFWIDAGFFRDLPRGEIYLPWPDTEKIKILGDKFLLLDISFGEKPQDEVDYYSFPYSDCSACFFGGQSKIVTKVGNEVLSIFDSMLDKNFINNEQKCLALVYFRYPENFLLYPYGNREIFSDLSISGKLKAYPPCLDLKVLGVATQEINEKSFALWKESLEKYGYNYSILGRNKPWQGWTFRTKLYLEELKKLEANVTILADTIDLFFTAPAWEAYNKFIEQDCDIMIGVESIIAYGYEKYPISRIEKFFLDKCESRFCFPNGGFLIGRTRNLINLLKTNLENQDDQAGYMDLLYEGKVNYSLDYDTVLIGNVPNNHRVYYENIFWHWDSAKKRYYNPHTGEYPVAFHFPGSNFKTMMYMYYGEGKEYSTSTEDNNSFVFIILILFFLFVFLIWLSRR